MPRAEYIAYLRQSGASEDDIKALTEGSFSASAIKAFDAMQAAAAAESARVLAEAKQRNEDYKASVDEWFNTVAQPSVESSKAERIRAEAEAARLRSLVAQSTDEGLRKVATEMGYKLDGTGAPPATSPNPGAPGFDPNKYFTRDEIVSIAQQEGEAIAIAQDIAFEHRQLFPDRPLNFRELRRDALAAKKPVEQFWQDKYGVAAAREKLASETKAAYEAKIRKEAADAVHREYAERAANPNLIPGSTSINPLAARPSAGREKQPWDVNLEGEKGSGNRVERAAKVWAERQVH